MDKHDEIATANKQHWEKLVQDGCGFTRPWLDLDPALIRQYASGQLAHPPEPLTALQRPGGLVLDLEWEQIAVVEVARR